MDLDKLLYKVARDDLKIANNRIVELSIKIEWAGAELQKLRAQAADGGALKTSSPVDAEILRPVPEAAKVSRRQSNRALSFPRQTQDLVKRFRDLFVVKRSRRLDYIVDEVCGAKPDNKPSGAERSLKRSEYRELQIRGWAIPVDADGPFIHFALILESGTKRLSYEGRPEFRKDVGAHLGKTEFAQSGFRFVIPMAEVSPGEYIVYLVGYEKGGALMRSKILSLYLY